MRIGVDGRNLLSRRTGIGRYVQDMCQQLALLGHELIVYLPHTPDTELKMRGNVSIVSDNARGAISRIIWGETKLPKLAEFDELDIFWGPAHRLPSRLSKNIPAVVTIHDLVWRDAPGTMSFQTWLGEALLMRPSLHRADQIIVDSNSTMNALEKYYPKKINHISLVYPGLTGGIPKENTTRLPLTVNSLSITKPYALFVGTLEPRKNLRRLMIAYSRLPFEIRNRLNLLVVGGRGWGSQDAQSLAYRLNIADQTLFTGYVQDNDLSLLYANSIILLFPSIYEGFGYPIIEANSYGIPVLTSNTSSMPEVAGDAGVIVDPMCIDSIYGALLRLTSDTGYYNQLASRARANADRFRLLDSVRTLNDIFIEVAGRARTR